MVAIATSEPEWTVGARPVRKITVGGIMILLQAEQRTVIE
jgi:hypothetical protein